MKLPAAFGEVHTKIQFRIEYYPQLNILFFPYSISYWILCEPSSQPMVGPIHDFTLD